MRVDVGHEKVSKWLRSWGKKAEAKARDGGGVVYVPGDLGPRWVGKTTLLRRLLPRARYVLFENPDVQARALSDPRALIEELRHTSSLCGDSECSGAVRL